MACGLGGFQCRAELRLQRRRRRRAVASGRRAPATGLGFVALVLSVPPTHRRPPVSCRIDLLGACWGARSNVYLRDNRHSTVLTESGQSVERDIIKLRPRKARIYTLLRSKVKVKYVHFYRAACNADAVLWWEFCLSVRPSVCLSHAWIVTKR